MAQGKRLGRRPVEQSDPKKIVAARALRHEAPATVALLVEVGLGVGTVMRLLLAARR